MKVRKSDWTLVREAEENGTMVYMSNQVTRKRTDLNKELTRYFNEKYPKYNGSFDEDDGEDVLYNINHYLEENNIDKHQMDFPFSSGSDIHLIPIGDNISLKVLVADEYYGDGDYAKYVMVESFIINENTSKKDVDYLIEFIEKYIA